MATVYVANAFSFAMLPWPLQVRQGLISMQSVADYLHGHDDWTSIIGHESTALFLSDQLGLPINYNRATVTLEPGDVLLLCQFVGGRLPEGATELPDGCRLEWRRIMVYDDEEIDK